MKKKLSLFVFSFLGICLMSAGVLSLSSPKTAQAQSTNILQSSEEVVAVKERPPASSNVLVGASYVSTHIPFIAGEGSLETIYNMTDEILLLTENQGSEGLCWAFTMNKVIETYIAKNFGEYYNLSETWIELAVKDAYSFYEFGGGGNSYYYETAINNYGVAMESQVSYDQAGELVGNDANYLEYFNHYKQYANKDMLTEFNFENYGNYKYALEPQATDIKNNIKHYIKNYGAMYVAVISSDFETNTDGQTYVCSQTMDGESDDTFHGVSIIGWDDEYTAGGYTGAWIALNSWGPVDQKYVYVMYDDLHASNNIYGITEGYYNGVAFTSTKTATDNETIKIVDSNTNFSSYTLNYNTNGDTLQQNIFSYDDYEIFNVTYALPKSWDLSTLELEFFKYNEEWSDYFVWSLDEENYTLNIRNYDYQGTFDILIHVKNNGAEKTYIKQMVIFTGGELAYINVWYPRADGRIGFNKAMFFNTYTGGTEYTLLAQSTTIYLEFFVNDFSRICEKIAYKSIEGGDATLYNTSFVGDPAFTVATNTSPAQYAQLYKVVVNSGTPILTFETTTLEGVETEYKITIITHIDTTAEFMVADYGDVDEANNTIYYGVERGDKYYLQDPVLGNQTFLGWYFDEDRTLELSTDIGGYYFTYADLMSHKANKFDYPYFQQPDIYIKFYPLFLSFSITYDLNGGSGNLPVQNLYNTDEIYEAPSVEDVSKFGYTLYKWIAVGPGYTLEPSAQYWVSDLNEYFEDYRELTLQAVWVENEFEVAFDLQGGFGDISPYLETLTYSTTEYYTIPSLGDSISLENYQIAGVKIAGTNIIYDIGEQVLISELAEHLGENGKINFEIVWVGVEYNLTYYVDGELLQGQTPNTHTYGTNTTLSNAPSRVGYDFDGWYLYPDFRGEKLTSISGELVTSDSSLYGRYIIQKYDVNFYWFDDSANIQQTIQFEYNQTFDISSLYELPVPSDAYKTAIFDCWCDVNGNPITENFVITSDMDIYAKYVYDYLPFEFDFYNYDGSFLGSDTFEFGQVVYFDAVNPEKPSTISETFTFSGWAFEQDGEKIANMILGGEDLEFDSNNETISLFACFTSAVREYSCTFYDVENNGIPEEITQFGFQVEYLTEIDLSIFVPYRPSTNTHQFVFEGWFSSNGYLNGNWGEKVTLFDGKQDLQLYAKYSKRDVLYMVSFYYSPSTTGALELVEDLTQYVTYQTEIDLTQIQGPDKSPTVSNYFEFAGWSLSKNTDETLQSITVQTNISLYAVYESFLNTYTITFLIPTDDGFEMKYEAVAEYGQFVDMTLYNNPERPSSYSKDFEFEAWYDNENYLGQAVNQIQILGDKEYYAKFTEIERTYNITLYAPDGTELKQFDYTFNDEGISLANTSASKPKTSQFEYEFLGWYSQNGEENEGDWGEKLEAISFNDFNTASEEDIHTTLYPRFEKHVREYIVNFYNAGTKLTNNNPYDAYLVSYGETASYDRAITKPSTEKYVYVFDGWTKGQSDEVVSDLTILQSDNMTTDNSIVNFYAHFSQELRKYTISLYAEKNDLTAYKTIECVWEENVNLSGENLKKDSTEKYYYEFKGWRYLDSGEKCPSNIVISGDLSLYADFNEEPIPFKLSEKAKSIIWMVFGGIVGLVALIVIFKIVISKGKKNRSSIKAQKSIAIYKAQQEYFDKQRQEIEEIRERIKQKFNKDEE